jgi:hypothetical protein
MNSVNFYVLPKRVYIQDDHVMHSFIYDNLGRPFLYHSQRSIVLNMIPIFMYLFGGHLISVKDWKEISFVVRGGLHRGNTPFPKILRARKGCNL